jgi:CMP-N,N'-diacetyllegionaminic acid synthase
LKILGIIPARSGSKGIPGKNIKLLGGKPLIVHAALSAVNTTHISRIILSTDSEEIAEIARINNIDVPFIRPKELALDTTPSIDVIIHALQFLKEKGEYFDAVCLLQPTSPFKPKDFIQKCVQIFIDSNADSFVSVLKVPHEFNPHWVFEVNKSGSLVIATGDKDLIPRRQELPVSYYRDGSIYITKTELLLKENKIIGGNISFIESNQDFYCNLDTMDDWAKAERMISINPDIQS